MLTGNKGEWSEVYALFKLLADRELKAGDASMQAIPSLIFPIIKILRDESDGVSVFECHDKKQGDIVLITKLGQSVSISSAVFREKAMELYEALSSTNNSGAFSLPRIESFLHSFNNHSLKAKSSKKTDIRIVVHDMMTGMDPLLGFSIKSKLGSPATLLNASVATNFIFKIKKMLTPSDIYRINNIATKSKIRDRLCEIGDVSFERIYNPIFTNNLTLIDSRLPDILSALLLNFYQGNGNTVAELTKKLEENNPTGFDLRNNHPFYHYKIKRFLSDVALGMTPAVVWNGMLDATGGYIVIKEDGDIVCYHIYNRNNFEDYLFNNTKLETPSSSKHGFGQVFMEDGVAKFSLNLQIRFI